MLTTNKIIKAFGLGLILTSNLVSVSTFAEIKVDTPAPNFTETDATGKTHSLSDFKGKWVVLEWTNKGCPFVKKHYESKNMQNLQAEFTKKGVVWVSVISSAEGKQGYMKPDEAVKYYKEVGSNATAVLIDSDGSMGKAFEAKTTPHMYIINPEGKLTYAGAIDSNSSADQKDIATSENYIKSVLNAGLNKETIKTKTTKAYGCGIKYN